MARRSLTELKTSEPRAPPATHGGCQGRGGAALAALDADQALQAAALPPRKQGHARKATDTTAGANPQAVRCYGVNSFGCPPCFRATTILVALVMLTVRVARVVVVLVLSPEKGQTGEDTEQHHEQEQAPKLLPPTVLLHALSHVSSSGDCPWRHPCCRPSRRPSASPRCRAGSCPTVQQRRGARQTNTAPRVGAVPQLHSPMVQLCVLRFLSLLEGCSCPRRRCWRSPCRCPCRSSRPDARESHGRQEGDTAPQVGAASKNCPARGVVLHPTLRVFL